MAITATYYELLKGVDIQRGSTLLEIGEANWHGDLAPEAAGLKRSECLFEIAKEFYEQWFAPSRAVAIDWNGTLSALRLDLNEPIDLGEQFDVVINHGTAEHIFNIGQVFRTMHDACELGGWMIHDAPFHGWRDHGFYCLQPTLFYDLARANCYEVAQVAINAYKSRTIIHVDSREQMAALGELPDDSMLFVVYRKRFAVPFQYPRQGYYAGTLSDSARKAWEHR